MNTVSNAKLFLFDLDGTVYHDGEPIGDAKNTLAFLRDNGCKIVYLTNNSSISKQAYIDRLSGIDILGENDIVYSSLDCAVDYFKKYKQGKKIYALCTDVAKKFLEEQGLELVNDKDVYQADVVLLCFDKELTYQKIVIANELLVMGKEYISTHPDFVCPTRGISIPDAGSFIEMFKASSGRTPDIILGKPYSYMADFLLASLGVSKEQTFMVGDRLYTDIMFGINSGINTITVLSGETTKQDYEKSGIKCNYLLKDINEIPKLIKEGK